MLLCTSRRGAALGVPLLLLIALGGCMTPGAGQDSGLATAPPPVGFRTHIVDLGAGVTLTVVEVRGPGDQVYCIGQCEVTQRQWRAVMGNDPSWYKGADLPVNRVSWADCRQFCEALSQSDGVTFRLPTEAEWEYACAAGSDGAYCFGDDQARLTEFAWYDGHAPRQPSPVGQKRANAWGLYDVHGNVREWCSDPDTAFTRIDEGYSHRVLKGGSWFDAAEACRTEHRITHPGEMRSAYIGFRVVMERTRSGP